MGIYIRSDHCTVLHLHSLLALSVLAFVHR